jgi:menaquinone-9 beta-reductase
VGVVGLTFDFPVFYILLLHYYPTHDRCAPGLDILEEMGCLQRMMTDGVVQVVRRGGFISPFGYKCINTDGASYGSETGCRTYAIKRHIADEYIVRTASAVPGVKLFEQTEIDTGAFSEENGVWTLSIKEKDGHAAPGIAFTGKMLLICDGSTSYLAQKLGYLPRGQQPEAICSHCYVKGGTHQWREADGVMIFNKATLPGYSALFRHYNDDMYL